MAANNIGCYDTGCTNPVIGQCSGYNRNCGQFYCRAHSVERLCGECGQIHADELTLQDYLKTAETIPKPPGIPFLTIGLIFYAILQLGAVNTSSGRDQDALGRFTVSVTVALVFLWMRYAKHQKCKTAIAEIEKVKPRFGEFYQEYHQKSCAERRVGFWSEVLGTVGAGIAGGVRSGVGEQVRQAREMREDGRTASVVSAIRDLEKKL
jgi:hypothetical protein